MKANKPLGGKAYGSIPHLPGSKYGNREDKGVDEKAAKYFLDKAGKDDTIYVLEKLDGSCVSVARVGTEIVALTRSGYPAISSPYYQHHMFADWVYENIDRFSFLNDGERVCGEWLAQAHGTRYDLAGRDPFVAFDLFIRDTRLSYGALLRITIRNDINYAPVLYVNNKKGLSVKHALNLLGDLGRYGAIDLAEGCVWRWERPDVIMLAKYVRPEKEIGGYLMDKDGNKLPEVWNWKP